MGNAHPTGLFFSSLPHPLSLPPSLPKELPMFSTLTIVGFVFAFAWVQQIFLNRIIASDMEYLKDLTEKQHQDRAKALAKSPLS